MADRKKQDDEQMREAKETLERVARESEVFGQSAVARAVDSARAHMSASEADRDDPVELWGRRIGRGLAVAGFIFVGIWLFNYLTR